MTPDRTVTIPAPHVPHGPKGIPEHEADADYLRHAAKNLRWAGVLGSNLTETVAQMCEAAADALMDAAAAHPRPTSGPQSDEQPQKAPEERSDQQRAKEGVMSDMTEHVRGIPDASERELARSPMGPTPEEIRRLVREHDKAQRELAWMSERLPCDGLCSDAPEEDCSRHGRTPKELWAAITEVQQQRDEARAEAEHERDLLAQAMWDARAALGYDNDGDKTPAATIAGMGYERFASQHVTEATQQASDYEDSLGHWGDAEARATIAHVEAFINQRPEFIKALMGTSGGDDQADYHRWQGHAEARRHLATRLGVPAPHHPGETVALTPTDSDESDDD